MSEKNKVAEAVKAVVNDEVLSVEELPEEIPLERCPCGQVPEALMLEMPNHPAKYGRAIGACCGVWGIEFFNGYQQGADTVKLASETWNRAVRG